jgi:hypothetical protein
MKSRQLKDYTPPKGYMITREATLVERKAIGRKALVDILAPEIWNMLHELSDNGFYITLSYFGRVIHWRYKDYIVEAFVSCVHTYRYDLPEFKDMLLDYEPTYVLRMHKLCLKNLRDEKSLRGNARKEEAMKHLRETMAKREERKAAKPVKIKIDLEIEAWL